MYLQVSEKVVYGLSCVALYIIYTIYSKYIYLKQHDTLDHIYIHPLNNLYVMYHTNTSNKQPTLLILQSISHNLKQVE